jgi:glutaminase
MVNPFPNWTGVGLVSGLSGSAPPASDESFADRRSREIPMAIESPVVSLLREIHTKYLVMRDGAVATYIPELARVAPDQFGIALATVDGHVYDVGDASSLFTIQSISKPLVYGLALRDRGRDAVLARIGVEPSGDTFNAILFDERTNRPFNSMVNTGAIATTSLVRGKNTAQRLERILDLLRALSGRRLDIDEGVYRSELATGHRNRAIAYLELNNGTIEGDVDAHLDLYFRQCSVLTTATDLALVAATLAKGGVHPITDERALAAEHVRDVLSVMTTCGMYDYAGEWELRVGLPAKSGVGGGIMAVLPGQLGIGVFSPRLDEHGNSHRGIRVCEELSSRLQLHLLDYRGRARPALRRTYCGSEIRSRRIRSMAAQTGLDLHWTAISLFEFYGNLFFGNTEQAVRRILERVEATYVILDLGRVTSVDNVAANLLRELYERLVESGRRVRFAAVSEEVRGRLAVDPSALTPSAEKALEDSEDALLQSLAVAGTNQLGEVPLGDFELVAALDPGELESLGDYLVKKTYAAGETIIKEGAAADSLYFLVAGSVDVCAGGLDDETVARLAAIDAGNVVGELALLSNRRRTADVIAANAVTALVLHASDFAAIAQSHPTIHAKLIAAVGESLSERLRRANAVILSLTR